MYSFWFFFFFLLLDGNATYSGLIMVLCSELLVDRGWTDPSSVVTKNWCDKWEGRDLVTFKSDMSPSHERPEIEFRGVIIRFIIWRNREACTMGACWYQIINLIITPRNSILGLSSLLKLTKLMSFCGIMFVLWPSCCCILSKTMWSISKAGMPFCLWMSFYLDYGYIFYF